MSYTHMNPAAEVNTYHSSHAPMPTVLRALRAFSLLPYKERHKSGTEGRALWTAGFKAYAFCCASGCPSSLCSPMVVCMGRITKQDLRRSRELQDLQH